MTGVHGLILLAVPAVLLARTAMPARRQLEVVAVAVSSVASATGILLVHAARQLPLEELPPLALAALALCAAALAAAYVVTARGLLAGRLPKTVEVSRDVQGRSPAEVRQPLDLSPYDERDLLDQARGHVRARVDDHLEAGGT